MWTEEIHETVEPRRCLLLAGCSGASTALLGLRLQLNALPDRLPDAELLGSWTGVPSRSHSMYCAGGTSKYFGRARKALG